MPESGGACPQESMNGACLTPNHLAQALCGLAGRGRQGDRAAQRLEAPHQNADGGRLAHARTTCEHEAATQGSRAHRLALLVRELLRVRVSIQPGIYHRSLRACWPTRKYTDTAGEPLFGTYQTGEANPQPIITSGRFRGCGGIPL